LNDFICYYARTWHKGIFSTKLTVLTHNGGVLACNQAASFISEITQLISTKLGKILLTVEINYNSFIIFQVISLYK